jgi:5-methylcytosine-specific restriction endonuclease McrA
MERLHRWKERNAARLAEVNRQAQRQRRGDVDFARILAEYGPVCHICGDDIEDDLEFDHVVPLSRGGAHAEENIRPSHEACNHWKGTRLMSELEQMAERVAS